MYFLIPLALLTAIKAGRQTSSVFLLLVSIVLLVASLGLGTSSAEGLKGIKTQREKILSPKERSEIARAYGRLPLSFEANLGQVDQRVRFIARGINYGLFLTANEAVLTLRAPASGEQQSRSSKDYDVLRMRLLGANLKTRISGLDELPGKTNYFIGNNTRKWRKGIPSFGKVSYQNIYPGIDLIYYGNQQQLEYDFVVAPGASVRRIKMAFAGMDRIAVDADGDLVLSTTAGDLRQRRPIAYQEVNGQRQEINVRYQVRGNTVGFEVGSYDSTRPLIIDPVLIYSSFLGGASGEQGLGIAVDGQGSAYLTGSTISTDFPVANPFQGVKDSAGDAFVVKLNPAGTSFVYSTFLGGNGDDAGTAIAVDAQGNAYVVGFTGSGSFPRTPGVFQDSKDGSIDGFVTKLNSTGSALVYSSFLGGDNSDSALGIAVDGNGRAHVVGRTDSTRFRFFIPLQRNGSPAYKSTNSADNWSSSAGQLTASIVNVLAVDLGNSNVVYAGTINGVFKSINGGANWNLTGGGTPSSAPLSTNTVAIDPSNSDVIYAGASNGVLKSTNGGGVYVQKNTGITIPSINAIAIDPATPATLYAGSIFGIFKSTNGGDNWSAVNNGLGLSTPRVNEVVIDPSNPNIVYIGTNRGMFKTTNGGGLWTSINSGPIGFGPQITALVIDPLNPLILYAAASFTSDIIVKTVDGGANWTASSTGIVNTTVNALAIDPVAPTTVYAASISQGVFKSVNAGANWTPSNTGLANRTVNAVAVDRNSPATVYAGANIGGDAFAVRFDPNGTALEYLISFGGNENEEVRGVGLDPDGNAYIIGSTLSPNLPVVNAFQSTLNGSSDAFVAKLNPTGTAFTYLTYLGGISFDSGRAIAVRNGSAYVVGETSSSDFPLANPFKSTLAPSDLDAYVTKFNSSGSALEFSTFLGGSSFDQATGVAVDSGGNVYVTGVTFSFDFPTLNAPQPTPGGSSDSFVTKLNSTGNALVYSTFLGGFASDQGNGIAVDASGDAYIIGNTSSPDFPTVNALQPTLNGSDAFVSKIGRSMELALSMTDSPDPVALGSNLTYNLTVTNNGELPATGVTLTDTLPAGATLVSATPGQGSCTGGSTVVCNLGTLNAGANTTVTIVIMPPAVRTINNTATVTANEVDPVPNNNSASQTTQVDFADVSVAGATAYNKVAPGARVNYLFTVKNNSGGAAEVTLTDNLPAGTTFVSCSANGGVCGGSGENRTVTFSSLAVGQSALVVLVATVNPSVAEGTLLSNTATVSSTFPDPNTGNNSATTEITVTATPLRQKTNGRVAFSTAGVFTVKADGSEAPVPFPGGSNAIIPRWSPDGTKMAFTVGKNRPIFPFDSFTAIDVVNADGTGLVTLADNAIDTSFNNRSGFAWSPDGTRVAYVGSDRFIYIANADGSGFVKLPNSPSQIRDIDWAPDGSRFVFSKDFGEIHVMNTDGSNLIKLVPFGSNSDGPTRYVGPRWSPDGTKILFVQTSNNFTDVFVMNSDGTGIRRLLNTDGTFGPAWSPDGTKLAFYQLTEVHVINFDGSNEITLATNESCCSFGSISWQPIPTNTPLPPPGPPPPIFSISGRVTNTTDDPIIFARLTISGTRNATLNSKADGTYSFVNLPAGGDYTITPSNVSFSFNPASRTFTNLTADQTGADFVASFVPANITGRVTDNNGNPLGGIKVTSVGGFPEGITFTDSNGFYSFPNVQRNRSYSISPDPFTAFEFVPDSVFIPNLTQSQVVNFVGTRRNTVQFASSSLPVPEVNTSIEVSVTRTGDTSAAALVNYATSDGTASQKSDFTAGFGTVRFGPGETNKSITILLTDDARVEGPESFTLTLDSPFGAQLGTTKVTTINITDNDTDPNVVNPIENSTFFVRQHYHDFLNREPDAGGLAFWVNEIESCGTDQACRELKRINVSAAFFLSIEFQETGYLVYRTYKTAFGDTTSPNVLIPVPIIRLNEFLPDTQRIGLGVQVGIGNWEEVLEANKRAYMLEFVQRQRFVTDFPLSMTPAQFVDKLNQNAGGVLSQVERDQLVNELAGAPDVNQGRAGVLRKVAEDSDLRRNETTRAFVLMQYYGYLRRNPDDPQDTNFGGWAFWLEKLNQFNGNFINAEMVKAFIVSIEYKERFGR